MTGSYWSAGITVKWNGRQWLAELPFQDDGFGLRWSTVGQLRSRYWQEDLKAAIETLKADAERLGIELRPVDGAGPSLFIEGDGEDEAYPLPSYWRPWLSAVAAKVGLEFPYEIEVQHDEHIPVR